MSHCPRGRWSLASAVVIKISIPWAHFAQPIPYESETPASQRPRSTTDNGGGSRSPNKCDHELGSRLYCTWMQSIVSPAHDGDSNATRQPTTARRRQPRFTIIIMMIIVIIFTFCLRLLPQFIIYPPYLTSLLVDLRLVLPQFRYLLQVEISTVGRPR